MGLRWKIVGVSHQVVYRYRKGTSTNDTWMHRQRQTSITPLTRPNNFTSSSIISRENSPLHSATTWLLRLYSIGRLEIRVCNDPSPVYWFFSVITVILITNIPIPFKFHSCTIFAVNLKAVNIFNRPGLENVFKNTLHLFFINIFYLNYKL